MICFVDHSIPSNAADLLAVQIPAYRVEANLIGFEGIPQLKDGMEDIMKSGETFIGYYIDSMLAGFVSFEERESEIDICRLVVHPSYFRKGIGRALMGRLLELNKRKHFIVSTGSLNLPARTLYKSLGFQEVKQEEVAAGVRISILRKS
ncbi:GNAT family N-acetyltransferase [Peribacillus kribbensis]|uniref:GNAT family N-acetyltransferase n=1 Tax=Peribacillus kribbensis TaxID=356658 RepID=UPI000429078C|nr:GNAT family N-acetyltransferase [Peribacillus kribbensis]